MNRRPNAHRTVGRDEGAALPRRECLLNLFFRGPEGAVLDAAGRQSYTRRRQRSLKYALLHGLLLDVDRLRD